MVAGGRAAGDRRQRPATRPPVGKLVACEGDIAPRWVQPDQRGRVGHAQHRLAEGTGGTAHIQPDPAVGHAQPREELPATSRLQRPTYGSSACPTARTAAGLAIAGSSSTTRADQVLSRASAHVQPANPEWPGPPEEDTEPGGSW